ncbi:hypothetical protein EDD22DRAFT_849951 [Suillus occidentalis]|nr:hypothetical protein EDD22DRAFT_849951 [Suillus occidentalis]
MKQCLHITDAEHAAFEDKAISDIIYGNTVVGWTYKGQSYYMGLLLKDFHCDNLKLLASPHIDDIQLHLKSRWDKPFLKKTMASFSMQFLHVGNWVRVVEGALCGKSGQVILTDHTLGSVSLEFTFNGHLEQIEVHLEEIERVFWVSDTIKVVAGPHLGIEGHIIQMRQDAFDICQNIFNEQVEVSKYYLDWCPLNHTMHSQLPIQQYLKPPLESNTIEIGDYIEVLDGKHMGKHGIVDWYTKGSTYLWFLDALTENARETSSRLSSISVPVAMVWRMSLTHTIQHTKDKGYDVRPGDVITVACGLDYQAKGVLHVPIRFCTEIKLHEVATRYGMRLNSVMLEGPELTTFCEMRKQSYLALPPRSTTPPVENEKVTSNSVVSLTGPSSSPSNTWSTWSERLDADKAYSPMSTANPPPVTHDPGLSILQTLKQRFYWTAVSPNFLHDAAIEHYHIPTSNLNLAPPCKKNQRCLILGGAHHRALKTVVNCWTKKKTVDLRLGETVIQNLGFNQICLVELAKHIC